MIVDKNGELLAEGANRVVAENDPTWHGEIEAIRNACKKVGNFKLDDCTLYTSAECCPMCAAAAYWAGIKKIYFASTVEDALEYGNFDDSMIYSELKKPTIWRSIPAEQLLRDEAVAVWRATRSYRARCSTSATRTRITGRAWRRAPGSDERRERRRAPETASRSRTRGPATSAGRRRRR